MHIDSLFLLQFACFIFMLFNSCSDLPNSFSLFWALVARKMGTMCPKPGLSMPRLWSLDAQALFTECTHLVSQSAQVLVIGYSFVILTFPDAFMRLL